MFKLCVVLVLALACALASAGGGFGPITLLEMDWNQTGYNLLGRFEIDDACGWHDLTISAKSTVLGGSQVTSNWVDTYIALEPGTSHPVQNNTVALDMDVQCQNNAGKTYKYRGSWTAP